MPLDFGGALLGALVQWTGQGAGLRVRRATVGTSVQAALSKIVTNSVEPAVRRVTVPSEVEAVTAAVAEHLGYRLDADGDALVDPLVVLRAWLAPLIDPAPELGGIGYLDERGVAVEELIDALYEQILTRIRADAVNGGPLAPLWQELAAAGRERWAAVRDHDSGRLLASISRQTTQILDLLGEHGAVAVPVVRPIGQVNPLELGVHLAPDPGGTVTAPLTAYLVREHDHELRSVLDQVTKRDGRPVLAVLTGDSATGKTRALWEATCAILPHWTLVAPADTAELCSRLERGVAPDTVLWLNETQRFLYGADGERVATLLTAFLAQTTRVAVLGTLWERPYWQALTAQGQWPDTYAAARDLLTGPYARRILVPPRLNSGELDGFAALDTNDPRFPAALAAGAADGKVIQHLTGGPELLDAYVRGSLFTPVEHALITAALDARRLGHRAPVPPAVLTAAADGYLAPSQRPGDPADLIDALTALGAGHRADGSRTDVRRAVTAVTALRDRTGADPAYEPHDYLIQHSQREAERVPAALWDALTRHTTDPDERLRLGREAVGRGLFRIATALLEPSAHKGNLPAMRLLATLLREAGHDQEAAAWNNRAYSLEDDNETPACTATIPGQWRQLGRALLQIDLLDCPDREIWARWARAWREWEPGDPLPPHAPPDMQTWPVAQERESWLQNAVRILAQNVAISYATAARAGLYTFIDVRDTLLGIFVSPHLNLNRRADEAHWTSLAESGDCDARRILARLRTLEGLTSEAEEWLRRDPSPAAWRDLARLLERTGRREESDACLRRAADSRDLDATCDLLLRDGRTREAERLLMHAVETGHWPAQDRLIALLGRTGRAGEADRLWKFGIEPGGSTAQPW
ncbi:hypothetical protein DQ384_28475 [Sphaerisporangium album]|uniref:Tetratricopeptide repeat protein n=1 Tax=Sphaerisporangium album TaxID=509200 RepID=A0A367FAW5_9ACTN|nr:hypothetical protein [Sphaerisporangium album]RCG26827.1 hypothetical protein DQ384_28475 [Sphaerisporangium album]